MQRADLNALEEAAGYAQLGADYGYAHADIARVVGKSRSHVANTLRLTNLPEHTQGAARARERFPPATAAPCSPSRIRTRPPTGSSPRA